MKVELKRRLWILTKQAIVVLTAMVVLSPLVSLGSTSISLFGLSKFNWIAFAIGFSMTFIDVDYPKDAWGRSKKFFINVILTPIYPIYRMVKEMTS